MKCAFEFLGDEHFLCQRRAHNEQHGHGVDGISMMDTHPTDFYHVDRARMSCQVNTKGDNKPSDATIGEIEEESKFN